MRINPNAVSLLDDRLWCVCDIPQCLLEINYRAGIIEQINTLPFYIDKNSDQYAIVHAFGGGVLVVPNDNGAIFVYDCNNQRWHSVQTGQTLIGQHHFSCSLQFGDKIFLLPGTNDSVLAFNTITYEIEVRAPLISTINEMTGLNISSINPVCRLNDYIIVVVNSASNHVFFYDVIQDSITCHRIGKRDSIYSSCAVLGDNVLLYDKNSLSLYLIYDKRVIVNELKLPSGGYRLLDYSRKYALIDAAYGNDLLVIDATMNSYERFYKSRKNGAFSYNVLGKIVSDGNNTYYYNKLRCSLDSINMSELKQCYQMPQFNLKMKEFARNSLAKKPIKEKDGFSLPSFIELY